MDQVSASSTPEPPELVTAEEKDRLGYEAPEWWLNTELQRKALANREQIYSVVQPYLERTFGLPVEMGTVGAPYPYDAIKVSFRTTTEPIVADSVFVTVGPDARVHSEADIETYSEEQVRSRTASGLFRMAYRAEIDQVGAWLAEQYPQFGVDLPARDMWLGGTGSGTHAGIRYDTGDHETKPARDAIEQRLYEAYLANPAGSDAEWRAIVDGADPGLTLAIGIQLIAKDPDYEFEVGQVREIVDHIHHALPIQGFTWWSIGVGSNLMTRDGGDFHHYVSIRWGTGINGVFVQETVDGGTVR
ncbi:hypothetical protein [Cellulomonas denverensis]|uniref:hypothetical protein n=1 Tax=Cellulomonas denverensis TaxID=264297 RepID=UPI0035ED50D9